MTYLRFRPSANILFITWYCELVLRYQSIPSPSMREYYRLEAHCLSLREIEHLQCGIQAEGDEIPQTKAVPQDICLKRSSWGESKREHGPYPR